MTESTDQRPSDLVQDDLPSGPQDEADETTTPQLTEDEVLEAMRDVIDPELRVNVVDLGMVYGVAIDDENNVTLDMTLTMPTCPVGPHLEYQSEMVLDGLAKSVAINWVWMPPWGMDKITDEGREQLRAVGLNI
ncbi:metal-sulfur cluster assembly factor [Parenemella sanctibonifatiensis]|uniref:Metal-sulfur cluster biosynthetic enzyme n=1 Tax=Parenemella sanctibonifatiensis TaxID=2016505 RepID=A0A255EKA9_9ACTN|nr:metal-sulfur cluster assembly factor [Parenemella sanctibonifatiensis]OYN88283.1 metal-sulfur cluster biosynthetic enzyme [Parenemella sanctibonifatiensis]OYN89882.1 metal-sulfur cluster biosynthetic enzyme [Parenemella sanctibonifatiensis]